MTWAGQAWTGRTRPIRLVLVMVVAILGACTPSPEPPPVVVIGVDGLEWDVALTLIREGRMPVLQGLMERGTYGLLSTQAPAKSPVIWTTVATGKVPAKHGILDFTREGDLGERVLYSSADRTTKALWNILGDAGQTSVVVGWWTTFPVESIQGVMVSQANTLERVNRRGLLKPGGLEVGVAGQVHPVEHEEVIFGIVEQVEAELPRILQEIYPDASAATSPGDVANLETCRWSIRADESSKRLAMHLAGEGPFPDLFLAYFASPDVAGHRFWRFYRPQEFRHPPSADQIDTFGKVIERSYEYADVSLGELLETIPDGADIFVISDHGMHGKRFDARFDVDAEELLARESGGHGDGPPGVLVAAGPSIRSADSPRPVRELTRADLPAIGDILDVTPTILTLRGIPVGDDMDGSVLESVLTPEVFQARVQQGVATHDTESWLADQRRRADTEMPGLDERLDQLRSLGYLDDD